MASFKTVISAALLFQKGGHFAAATFELETSPDILLGAHDAIGKLPELTTGSQDPKPMRAAQGVRDGSFEPVAKSQIQTKQTLAHAATLAHFDCSHTEHMATIGDKVTEADCKDERGYSSKIGNKCCSFGIKGQRRGCMVVDHDQCVFDQFYCKNFRSSLYTPQLAQEDKHECEGVVKDVLGKTEYCCGRPKRPWCEKIGKDCVRKRQQDGTNYRPDEGGAQIRDQYLARVSAEEINDMINDLQVGEGLDLDVDI